jgi:cysteine desulfurase
MAELADEAIRLAALREALAARVIEAAPDAVVFGVTAPRLPNTYCLAITGVEAATLMIALDLAGVAVSSGSACSSGKVTPSHVLAAMGVSPDLARGAIRLSLGWGSAASDVERFAEAFAAAVGRIRAGRTRAAI